MGKKSSENDDKWTVDASGGHQLLLRRKDAVAEVAFVKARQRWGWKFSLPPEFESGPQPSALACSLEAAKAACEAIAAGIGELGHPEEIARPQLQNHRWRTILPHYFRLAPRHGRYVASVSHSDSTNTWMWYFADLPREWWGKGLPPNGMAISMELAKAVCEIIVAGTVESQPRVEEQLVALASLKIIPFKHGRMWSGSEERRAFERKINFRFPTDLLDAYGDWNGGSLDGYFVFDTAICKEMCGSTFFSLGDIDAKEDNSEESILTAVRNSALLKKYPLNEIPFIPFAEVGASRAAEERRNPYNVPSLLAFERKTKSVFLLSGHKNRKVFLAKSWKEFASMAEVVFEE